MPVERVLELGLGIDGDRGQFDMTAFSLRLTNGANAVSKLHARHRQRHLAERRSTTEILAVTNGVHGPTWVGAPVASCSRDTSTPTSTTLDAGPRQDRFWERLDRIPTGELWEAHLRQKRELAIFARGRLRSQFARHGEAPAVLAELETSLDPDVLTIGFARRFATYKRAGLLFSDMDRLARLLWRRGATRPDHLRGQGPPGRPTRPEGHPGDLPALAARRSCAAGSSSSRTTTCGSARFLVQGVDVWLNNPRRPLEASGTSGMKAAQNGVPNISVLDGWWDEGYERRQRLGDRRPRDRRRRGRPGLVRRAGPLPAARGGDRPGATTSATTAGIPLRWVETMRRAMATSLWQFSTTRMLQEYAERLYLPAAGVEVPAAVAEPVVTEAG